MGNEIQKKGFWDIVDIIVKPLGGLMTALVIAVLGHQLNANMTRQQAIDSDRRLYTELMSQREKAESDLRKDMFTKIIADFMEPEKGSLESKVLNIELLTHNFHESLNLKPLFTHLKKKIETANRAATDEKQEYLKRLYRVAREITRKQMVALETVGQRFDRTVEWLNDDEFAFMTLAACTLTLDGQTRTFRLDVSGIKPEVQELEIDVEIATPDESEETKMVSFGLGFFDFPMIDNIRLSHDQRCAVVLNYFGDTYADITVVYFPGCYASLKEKPFYQDVVEKLRQTTEAVAGGG